jgi:hypothetical protein
MRPQRTAFSSLKNVSILKNPLSYSKYVGNSDKKSLYFFLLLTWIDGRSGEKSPLKAYDWL